MQEYTVYYKILQHRSTSLTSMTLRFRPDGRSAVIRLVGAVNGLRNRVEPGLQQFNVRNPGPIITIQ